MSTIAVPRKPSPVADLLRDLPKLMLAGLAGHLVWEFFARLLTRWLLGGPLEPAALIISLCENLFAFNPGRPAAEVLHYATGILFYPVGYYILIKIAPALPTWLSGLIWGVVTWILALGVFASLAGLPFMLGFIPLSWFSLAGHVFYGLVLALVFARLTVRRES